MEFQLCSRLPHSYLESKHGGVIQPPKRRRKLGGPVCCCCNVRRQCSWPHSSLLTLFEKTTCRIIGSRRYSADLPQEGLELPCQYIFRGDIDLVKKLKKLLATQACSRSGSDGPPPEKKIRTEDVDIIIVDDRLNSSTAWQSHFGIQLLDSDQPILQSEQLSAHHIDFAQEILKRQFPSICDLQSTLLLSTSH